MKEYIRNIIKTNELILNGTLPEEEIRRMSKSDCRWAENKKKSFCNWRVLTNRKNNVDETIVTFDDFVYNL